MGARENRGIQRLVAALVREGSLSARKAAGDVSFAREFSSAGFRDMAHRSRAHVDACLDGSLSSEAGLKLAGDKGPLSARSGHWRRAGAGQASMRELPRGVAPHRGRWAHVASGHDQADGSDFARTPSTEVDRYHPAELQGRTRELRDSPARMVGSIINRGRRTSNCPPGPQSQRIPVHSTSSRAVAGRTAVEQRI